MQHYEHHEKLLHHVPSILCHSTRLKTWISRYWTSGGNSRGLIFDVSVCQLTPSFARCWAPSTKSPWICEPISSLSRKRTLKRCMQMGKEKMQSCICTQNTMKPAWAMSVPSLEHRYAFRYCEVSDTDMMSALEMSWNTWKRCFQCVWKVCLRHRVGSHCRAGTVYLREKAQNTRQWSHCTQNISLCDHFSQLLSACTCAD